MVSFSQLINFVFHFDKYLSVVLQEYGYFTYGILFLIVFLETGFVFTPFLPGDSLLFAAGAFAAQGAMNHVVLFLLLSLAAIVGDTANYWIGHKYGTKILHEKFKLLKKEHIEKTERFYQKYGKKAIIIARFVPIVRTFAPFVAGIGKMNYGQFLAYNVIGGICWVGLFVFGGYLFGNVPIVQQNFGLAIILIIIVSFLPILYEYIRHKRRIRPYRLSMSGRQ